MNSINFNNPEFINDPYPTYRLLLETGIPYLHTQAREMNTSGIWLFSRYEDVVRILKEKNAISKQISFARPHEQMTKFDLNLLHQDPPTHTRLRDMIKGDFTTKKIKAFEPKIKQIANQLVVQIPKQTEVDFMTAFARPLALTVMAELIGIPSTDYDKVNQWTVKISRGFDSITFTADIFQQQTIALEEITDYFEYLINHHRQNPSDNLICLLLKAYDSKLLDYSEMLTMLITLLMGGYENTANLFGCGLLTLFRHPEQLNLLRDQPNYMDSAINEMLRFESPAQRTTFRITTQDFEINGKHFRAGEQITGLIGAANRDPAQFPEPDKFDITRSPNSHLAFGLGIHTCLGGILAHTEARIGFSELLSQLPTLRLATHTHPQWKQTTFLRGLQSLPVLC